MTLLARPRTLLTLALSFLLLLLVACGADSTARADEAMADEAMADEAMADEAMADEAMADEAMDDEAMADEAMDDDAMHDDMADDDMADEAMADEAMADEAMDDDAMADSSQPAWMQIALTDAQTGESFTLGDFAGRTVFVEPMATWCTNCRRQLTDLTATTAQFTGDDVLFIAISVETTLDNQTLASYAADNGYPFTFAVASEELVRALAAEFGQSVANPPSTPHFIIRADGSFTDLDTGFESADELAQQIRAAQG